MLNPSMLSSIWLAFAQLKEVVQQKRKDIFVDSLVLLGYIIQNEDGKYELAVEFDKERFIFIKIKARKFPSLFRLIIIDRQHDGGHRLDILLYAIEDLQQSAFSR